ncbi:FAD-binding oxidoreductase, partial [Sphingomonas bacterium]|uniref:FAD-binding oxidoreductase n=1 Tax=Sphingomonas bacterium TaxID=1895847 RepID=UPI0026706AA7
QPSADPQAALALLRRLQRRTDAVESFELLPAESLAAVLAHVPGARAPLSQEHRWHVLVEAVSADPVACEPDGALDEALGGTLADWLAPSLADGLIEDAAIAASEAQAEAFWRIRDSISDAERATGPAVQHDISVPVDAMPRFMVDAAAACEARFPGTRASGFGHLGDGNVHFHVRAPAPPILTGAECDAWYAREAPAITRFVHDLVVAAGGSISAEHGIGQMKLGELERLGPPARLHAMRAIKAAMDPLGLMNPGKLVAPALAPACLPA